MSGNPYRAPERSCLRGGLGWLRGVKRGVRRDPCKVLVFSEVQVLTRHLDRSSR